MSDMRIAGLSGAGNLSPAKGPGREGAGGFDEMLQEAVGKISRVQKEAETAVAELSSGGDVTNAILAMEKADMTFQAMVEVRNRLLSAYEEIMRMQI